MEESAVRRQNGRCMQTAGSSPASPVRNDKLKVGSQGWKPLAMTSDFQGKPDAGSLCYHRLESYKSSP